MECNKCSLAIDRKTERYTICEGKCAKRYHAACVGLSEATVCALFSKNILWMCDECLVDFCSMRDANSVECTDTEIDDTSPHPSTITSDVAELKLKVAQITETLATIVAQRTTQSQQLPFEMRHSTPVVPPVRGTSLLDGTNTYHKDNTEGLSVSPANSDNNEFALFLTNIDCHTTEDHISRLVHSSLEINNSTKLKVHKLVPRGRTCNELDYVSFKVTLDAGLKTKALKPSTWPLGIKFREFESRNFTWKPPM